MKFKQLYTIDEVGDVLQPAEQLLAALERMFENPTYQSVFLAAAKNNVYFAGEDIQPYFENLKNVLCEEEQVEDPVVDGDKFTVIDSTAAMYAGVWPGGTLH